MRKLLLLMSFMVALCVGLSAQTKTTITGTVLGDDGLPIPGASVIVKGTTVGTVTDIDGKYTLQVPEDAKDLVFTFIGMQRQEHAIDGKKVVNAELLSDSELVSEVVVTAYGTTTKEAFTGSAGVIKTEELQKRQVSNVTNALSGAVAGVQITSTNGQPGESSKVRIRGIGSINAGSAPLYVVDGIPFDGDLSSINSADIETLTVLKDAASTSLYGARGSNGVIMITTKKGRTAEAQITFDAKYGVNSRQIKNYDVLTSPQEYMEKVYTALYNGAYYNLGATKLEANDYANATYATEEQGGIGYEIYDVPAGENLFDSKGKINSNAKLGYSDGDFFYTPDNWEDETFSNNARSEYNLTMSAATEKGSYYLSFGYLDDSGVIDNSGFKRYSIRAKGDHQFKSWLKAGANMSYSAQDSRYPGDQDENATASSANAFYIANNMAPIYPLYVRDASGKIMTNNGRKVYDYGDGNSTNFSRTFMSIANPAGRLVYDDEGYKMDIMNSTWFADITPIKGLTISARYGLSVDNTQYTSVTNPYYGQSAAQGGSVYKEDSRSYGFDQQYIATYAKTFMGVHNIDVMAGYDGYEFSKRLMSATGNCLYNPSIGEVNNTINQRKGSSSFDSYATEGYVARANYNYSGTYYVSASFRRDASSRFSKDNRWGNFWSASAAWNLIKEDFLSTSRWIDMLKLKASFGQQGNDQITYQGKTEMNYHPYLDQYKLTGADSEFSDGTLYAKGNKDLTWETSNTFNIGVDFSVLESRLSGSAEYFIRQSSDMIYYKPSALILGYSSIPMNVGSMRNSGLEIDLTASIIKNENVDWKFNVNATFIKNKIVELAKELNGELIDGSRIYSEGESMYRMYLVRYAGVDENTGEALYWSKDENSLWYRTSDYSEALDYKVATDDLLPKVYGGFGTTADFFGFDASAQFAYQLGGKIYDSGYRYLMHGGYSSNAGNNWHTDIRKAWTEDNKNTDVPRLDSQDKYACSSSDRWITKSNYLALNNITVGYTLPHNLTEKFYIEKFRVYFAADNVALISARKGLDPRQSYTTSTTSLYTQIRTISGGLNIIF